MDLRALYAGGAAVFVVAILALVIFGSDDEPDSKGGAQSAQLESGGDPESTGQDVAPPANGAIDGPEARAAARTVTGVYGGLRSAVADNVAPLDVDPRLALTNAEKVASLRQICDLFSSEARADTVKWIKAFARLADVDWTCEKAVALMIRNSRTNHALKRSLRAKVIGVNIVGDHGTATLDFGGGEPVSGVSIVKEGDSWKIGSLPGTGK